jgi:hypothetical protein
MLGDKVVSLQQWMEKMEEHIESVKSKTAETERRCELLRGCLSTLSKFASVGLYN